MSDNQRKILEFITLYVKKHKYAPSYREIGNAVGMSSVASVNYNVSKLAIDGYIEKGSEPRTIKVNDLAVIDFKEYSRIKREAKQKLAKEITEMIQRGAKVEDIKYYLGDKYLWKKQ